MCAVSKLSPHTCSFRASHASLPGTPRSVRLTDQIASAASDSRPREENSLPCVLGHVHNNYAQAGQTRLRLRDARCTEVLYANGSPKPAAPALVLCVCVQAAACVWPGVALARPFDRPLYGRSIKECEEYNIYSHLLGKGFTSLRGQ